MSIAGQPAPGFCLPPRLDAALRWAALQHKEQFRRGGGIPYVQHVVGVAWALERAGFGEDVVVAGLLHDVVEDTDATFQDVEQRFGGHVRKLVEFCSEVKLDEAGNKRPWIDRKRDHLAVLTEAPVEAKAIALADKLHNLLSIKTDLEEGRSAWEGFNASRERVLWYYEASCDACGIGDPRLERLAGECRAILSELKRTPAVLDEATQPS